MNANEAVGTIAGSGEIDLDFWELTISGSQTRTFSGLIDGDVDSRLMHAGSGILTLNRAGGNIFGQTIINSASVLANNSSGSATGSGGVTVNSGGTLGGSGRADGSLVVNSGSNVEPGAPGGILKVGAVSFTSISSTLDIQLAGLTAGSQYDRLAVDGTASLFDAALTVSYRSSFTAAQGDTFDILTAASLSGSYNSFAPPDGQDWFLDVDTVNDKVTIGVVCVDDDNDGVCDDVDICPGFNDGLDDDIDGVPNGCDICLGEDATGDSDGDGVCDDIDTPTVHNITQGFDYFTIQAAIDASVNGDVIEDDAQTYHEAINFNGKTITLRSSSGDANDTIIHGTGHFHVVQCVSGEDPNTVLEGFTITGGNANGASPDHRGGGMYNDGSSPTITHCIFDANRAWQFGGGMFTSSSPTMAHCSFIGNTSGSQGGGFYNLNVSLTISSCTFVGNTAAVEADGIFSESGNLTVTNSIPFGSMSDPIVNSFGAATTIAFSNVQGGLPPSTVDGGGNIDADPLFVRDPIDGGDGCGDNPGTPGIDEGANDDYGDLCLLPGSPSIDAGDNTAVPVGVTTDLDGNLRFIADPNTFDTGTGSCPLLDMGSYEFQATGSDGDNDNNGVYNSIDLCEGFDDAVDSDSDTAPDGCDFCPGDDRADLSADQTVSLVDFALLEADFGCTSNCTADIKNDGSTDLIDAALLFEAWLCGT